MGARYIFVQLDLAGENIISYFGECFDPGMDPMVYPQDPEVWPNQATITNGDPRYIAFYNEWNGAAWGYIPIL